MLVVGYLYPKDLLEKLTIALFQIFPPFFQGYVIQFVNIAMNEECSSSGFFGFVCNSSLIVVITRTDQFFVRCTFFTIKD